MSLLNWQDRPTKAEVKHHISDGEAITATVYEIGRYVVTVSGPDAPEVTYRTSRDHMQADPRKAFPSMEVEDGVLRIPVEDFVPLILSRLEPLEIAQALWQEDGVKSEFMDCLAPCYSRGGIGDDDRRRFLAKIKEAIHSKALDRVASAAQALEHRAHQVYQLERWAREIIHHGELADLIQSLEHTATLLEGDGCRTGTAELRALLGTLQQITSQAEALSSQALSEQTAEASIGRQAWDEARAYWRKWAADTFTAPEVPEEATEPEGVF